MGVTKKGCSVAIVVQALSTVLLGLTSFCNYVLSATSLDHGPKLQNPNYWGMKCIVLCSRIATGSDLKRLCLTSCIDRFSKWKWFTFSGYCYCSRCTANMMLSQRKLITVCSKRTSVKRNIILLSLVMKWLTLLMMTMIFPSALMLIKWKALLLTLWIACAASS